MSKNKLKYRAICPQCKKPFNLRDEGMWHEGYIYCADCYRSFTYRELYDYKK